MEIQSNLQAAWRSLWVLRRHHGVAARWRVLVAASLGANFALALMGLVALFGTVGYPNWFIVTMLPTILICICITLVLLATLRLSEVALPAALVERMSAASDVCAALLLCAIALCGIVAGLAFGFALVPPLFGYNWLGAFRSAPIAGIKLALFLLVLAAGNRAWWRARMRQQAMQREAIEAQLRLLQAQIEPHFLFNTLANVQSLMDYDPARAKRMLEAFSDYLRTGLLQLRETDSTLGAELEMVHAYLELLQIRMEDRLTFAIDASIEARAARLPTLLLQPLVENAIHHGLEPKIEGGHIRISATLDNGRISVHVDDDGMGLDARRRTLRSGTGMALANLRARLHTRYGAHAQLALLGRTEGARATLELPCAP
ncbi:MAG: histidine kinase [Pseudomonadota bacterium]